MVEYARSAPEDEALDEFDALMRRSYGAALPDPRLVPPEVELVLGREDGRVVSGGLGFCAEQAVGGRWVTAAVAGAGCVAPERRGGSVAPESVRYRLRSLAEQGAVVGVVWSSAARAAVRHGMGAPVTAFTADLRTDELARHGLDDGSVAVSYGPYEEASDLRRSLASGWNGAVAPPAWWGDFLSGKHGGLDTYHLRSADGDGRGALSLAFARTPEGLLPVVHELWASDSQVASAALGFLGRLGPRHPRVRLMPTALPPLHFLREGVRQLGDAVLVSGGGWLTAILDLPGAVAQRGWSRDVDVALTLEVRPTAPSGPRPALVRLEVADGTGSVGRARGKPDVVLTESQLADWYMGAFRSVADARFSGVRGADDDLAALLAVAGPHEPWMNVFF